MSLLDPDPLSILLTVLALFAGAALVYLNFVAERQRRESMAALAARLGFRFGPSKDSALLKRLRRLAVFDRGNKQDFYNTISGEVEVDGRYFDLLMGDFTYRVAEAGTKRREAKHNLSYIVIHLPWRSVPHLTIRPESVADRILAAIGHEDIEFESDRFNRRFLVRCSDKRFAHSVVHPRMMDFLMDGCCYDLEVADGYLCLSTGKGHWVPEAFELRLEWLRRFLELWPDWLLDDLNMAQ